jgi:hypothetical protein
MASNIQAFLDTRPPSSGGRGFNPSIQALSDLNIRIPRISHALSFAGAGKGAKVTYGNPKLSRQPAPNVIILVDDPRDLAAINGSHITAPQNSMVIVAHGGAQGIQRANGKSYFSSTELANFIKNKVGRNLSLYSQIIFVSCRAALAGNGSYMQSVANALGKPVHAATEFGYVHSSGRISIAGSTSHVVGARKRDDGDLGRFIRFDPGGKPKNSSAMQSALKEQGRANEDIPGAGSKYDDEFTSLKSGRCVNATVEQCINK